MDNTILFNSVESSYKAVTLKFFYDKYLYQFDYKRKALGSDKPKLDKLYLTELLTYVFDNEKIFKELINVLPPIVEKILQVIIFEDSEISTVYLEKRYGMEIVRKDTTHYNDEYKKIDPAFFLFSIKSKENNYREPDYILSLPKIIRYRLKTYYPVPEEYMLKPIEQIDKISYFYENNNSILDDLPMYKKFLEHEKLAFSSQDRPLKGALKATKDVCEIQEFYNSSDLKDVEYTRTELIISFLMYELSTNKTTKEPVKGLEYLKKIFNNYESGRSFYTFVLLYHIKRLRPVIEYSRYNYFEMNQTFNKNIFKVLKSLKVEQWFSFENVYKFITYNEFDFDLINDRDARDTYLNSKFERVYDDKIYIKEKVIYQEAIIKPAIKASFFLLASFGIIDIAYNLPKNKIEQKGKNYLSIFDGLEYVKLTALGAYIIGLTKSFESDISSKKDAAIILDENELMINISGKNKLKTMFLKTFAAQISDNIYKVDYSSFLNECNNPKDIKKKITLFKQEVSEDYPKIWDNFFKEIVKKSVALEKSEGMIVYKLRKDQELIDLILKDEVLKKNILKVENFQIAIDKKDLSRVRKRLEEFGYVGIID